MPMIAQYMRRLPFDQTFSPAISANVPTPSAISEPELALDRPLSLIPKISRIASRPTTTPINSTQMPEISARKERSHPANQRRKQDFDGARHQRHAENERHSAEFHCRGACRKIGAAESERNQITGAQPAIGEALQDSADAHRNQRQADDLRHAFQ
jgi:hypothetical protein